MALFSEVVDEPKRKPPEGVAVVVDVVLDAVLETELNLNPPVVAVALLVAAAPPETKLKPPVACVLLADEPPNLNPPPGAMEPARAGAGASSFFLGAAPGLRAEQQRHSSWSALFVT